MKSADVMVVDVEDLLSINQSTLRLFVEFNLNSAASADGRRWSPTLAHPRLLWLTK